MAGAESRDKMVRLSNLIFFENKNTALALALTPLTGNNQRAAIDNEARNKANRYQSFGDHGAVEAEAIRFLKINSSPVGTNPDFEAAAFVGEYATVPSPDEAS